MLKLVTAGQVKFQQLQNRLTSARTDDTGEAVEKAVITAVAIAIATGLGLAIKTFVEGQQSQFGS